MKYISKVVEIEAVEFTNTPENIVELGEFMGDAFTYDSADGIVLIETLEGTMKASIGDFIIKGLVGEFYPCKPDVFAKKYISKTEDSLVKHLDDCTWM